MGYYDELPIPVRLREAATTGDLPNLLREDYKDILLSAYADVEKPEMNLCYRIDSNNYSETYRGLKPLYELDRIVPEGAEYPELKLEEKSTKTITNFKRGYLLSVTDEMIRFNKLAELGRMASMVGNDLGVQVSKNIISALETSGNYTAYGSTITLTAANLELALVKFRTQTDTSADAGTVKLGLVPDTLLVPPDLEYTAKRLLLSSQIPGSANNDVNVLQGGLKLVVSHYLASSTVWYLLKTNWANGLIFQSVIGPPPELSTQDIKGENQPDSVFRYDKITYKARMMFGIGVIDAKAILRSTS